MEASLVLGIWCMGGMSNISLDAIHLITSARTEREFLFLFLPTATECHYWWGCNALHCMRTTEIITPREQNVDQFCKLSCFAKEGTEKETMREKF